MAKNNRSHTVERLFRHGGAVVLVARASLPLGESARETHLHALAERLFDYAQEEFLPRAKSELEQAVKEGHAHRFRPYRCLVEVAVEKPHPGVEQIKVTLSLRAKEELLCQRSLSMYWDISGEFQLMRLPRRIEIPFFGRRWGEKRTKNQKPDG